MVAIEQNKAREEPLKLFSHSGHDWVEITLPIMTVSEANGGRKKVVVRNGKRTAKREHWTDANKRHKQQKGMVRMMLGKYKKMLHLPCEIIITRYAPKKLDRFDNLPMSMKWILDAVCEVITGDYRPGRADDDKEEEIEVRYKQIVSEHYGVKIHIQCPVLTTLSPFPEGLFQQGISRLQRETHSLLDSSHSY